MRTLQLIIIRDSKLAEILGEWNNVIRSFIRQKQVSTNVEKVLHVQTSWYFYRIRAYVFLHHERSCYLLWSKAISVSFQHLIMFTSRLRPPAGLCPIFMRISIENSLIWYITFVNRTNIFELQTNLEGTTLILKFGP